MRISEVNPRHFVRRLYSFLFLGEFSTLTGQVVADRVYSRVGRPLSISLPGSYK
jgi:hypothetical protein